MLQQIELEDSNFKSCLACEERFLPNTDTQKFCTATCRYRHHARIKRNKRAKEGDCPQCGQEWLEPRITHRGKPKHCLRCQKYYKRNNRKKRLLTV